MGESEIKRTEFSKVANDVYRFADQIKNAGDFIPAGLKGNAGAIAACILTGRELGFEPMASLRLLYVYKGHVGVYATGIIALLKRKGYKVEWPELTDEVATVKITGPDKTSIQMSYTKKDAKTAGLWEKVHNTRSGDVDSVWKLHPKAMLRARCISNAAKAFAGEVLSGIYTPNEIDEIKEREEKPINTIKETRKSGADAAKIALGIIEEDKEKENSPDEAKAEDENSLLITETDLLLDELDEINSIEDIDIFAEKIKSKKTEGDFSEEDKATLRKAYKEKRESLNG